MLGLRGSNRFLILLLFGALCLLPSEAGPGGVRAGLLQCREIQLRRRGHCRHKLWPKMNSANLTRHFRVRHARGTYLTNVRHPTCVHKVLEYDAYVFFDTPPGAWAKLGFWTPTNSCHRRQRFVFYKFSRRLLKSG